MSPPTELDPSPPSWDYDLFNREAPRSLISLVPAKVADAFEAARFARPDLMGLDERELMAKLKEDQTLPNATDYRMRLKFWMEYDAAQEKARKVQIGYVFAGICTSEFFYRKYLSNPSRVAWLLCVPANYEIICREALHFGLEQLRDILDTPHNLPDGSPNTKLMEIKAKIVNMLDQRIHGSALQKTLSLNVTATEKKVGEIAEITSMDELKRRMDELRKRERKAQNIIEAIPIDTEQTDGARDLSD